MESQNISFIILKTGEKILTEAREEGEIIHVKNPLEVFTYTDPATGRMGFSFTEWVPKLFVIEAGELPINRAEIRISLKPSPMLEACYTSCFVDKDRKKIPVGPYVNDEGFDGEALEDDISSLEEQLVSDLGITNTPKTNGEWDEKLVEYMLRSLPKPKYPH